MKRLPERFTKFGTQFECLCRTENTAVYLRHINGRQKSYEVIVIRVADRRPEKTNGKINWVFCDPFEAYPSNEKWGQCAWTYSTEAYARKKYALINDPSFKLPAPPIYPIRARALDGFAEACAKAQKSILPAEVD